MFKAEIRIEHHGCWGSDVNAQFPDFAFSSVDCRWIGGQVAHLVKVQGDGRQFDGVIRYFHNRSDVTKTEVLSRDGDTLYLRVLTKKLERIGQFSDVFFSQHCFPLAPTRFVGREEVWTLGTADKRNLATVIRFLRRRHKTKIRYLKEEAMREPLTPKQREALNLACHMGYYDWPRKESVTDLAKMALTSKTAFISALRKAERKIMRQYGERTK